MFPKRPISFVLTATNHGSLIVNRNDYRMVSQEAGYGVGFQLLVTSEYDIDDVQLGKLILDQRRAAHGDGVCALDIGANIGVLAVEWGRHMAHWGNVYAFEAQERVYYALAGNIALNNCHNVRAQHMAIGETVGMIDVPVLDVLAPASFGSLELRPVGEREDVGQPLSGLTLPVQMVNVDAFTFTRLDLIKIDVEGMELDVLNGAEQSIAKFRPAIVLEHAKIEGAALKAIFDRVGYRTKRVSQLNSIALHADDALWAHFDA